MAPNRGANRRSEFEDAEDVAPKDFDPEADIPDSDSDAASDEEDDSAAREHYVDVGKSKLRKPKDVALGPQYSGSRISRAALGEDEDEDDPFSKGFDDMDSESEDSGLGADVSDDEDVEDDGSDDEDVEDGTDATDVSEGEGEDAVQDVAQDRAELRKIMAAEQKTVAASISAATKADAEKGRAVKKQRIAFDSLLNTRIKLQKSLIATNTLVAPASSTLDTASPSAQAALEAAEKAAFTLWSALTTFRDSLTTARTGSKRKRPAFTSSTPTSELHHYTTEQENLSIPHRNATLQKWSLKARNPTAQPSTSRLASSLQTPQLTLPETLATHLSDPTRLLSRAQTPRSCAPLQLAAAPSLPDTRIYDDADFYGLLLKSLLESKTSTAAANIDISSFANLRRDAKTKRPGVDVKASKGRKLKYTVHEKLQNFMAPEEVGRGWWGERQSEELFGSLFGNRVVLSGDGEDEDEDAGSRGEEGGLDAGGEAGMMMFRR